jgi:hypothetical protein
MRERVGLELDEPTWIQAERGFEHVPRDQRAELREALADILDQQIDTTKAEELLLYLLEDGKLIPIKQIAILACRNNLLTNWNHGLPLLESFDNNIYIEPYLTQKDTPINSARVTLRVVTTADYWQVTNEPQEVLVKLTSRKLPKLRDWSAPFNGPSVIMAEEFLASFLHKGPQSLDAIRLAADSRGISWRSLERAKHNFNIKSVKAGFPGRVVAWSLPVEIK